MLNFRTIDADRLKNRFTGQCLTRGTTGLVVQPCGESNQRWDRWIQNKPFFFFHGLHNEGAWRSTNRCLSVRQNKKTKEYNLISAQCDYSSAVQEWDEYKENIYNVKSNLHLNVNKDGKVFLSKESGPTSKWFFIRD